MHINRWLVIAALVLATTAVFGQAGYKAVVRDKVNNTPLQGVVVTDKHGHGGVTNDSGQVVVTGLGNGKTTLFFSYVGYQADSAVAILPDETRHTISLKPDEEALEQVLIISSTRSNERIENAPTKVEVLGKEEMEEENSIKPANVAGIIGDVSGVQLQQSSATSGNTNVRIQGLNGQYTQILRDGMPLYEGFSGGFGVLQIPPLDLRQIEIIKGSSSTLYGGGAIAGLINLISKRPAEDVQDGVFTFNATTLQEQDVNVYLSKREEKLGYTLFAGYAHQNAVDVNGDGFSDVPDLNSFTLHPRLFIYPNAKTTLMLGYVGSFEKRIGGSVAVINNAADSLHQYFEKDITRRNTGELIFEHTLPKLKKLTIKGSFSSFDRDILTNLSDVKGNQQNYYGEASLYIPQMSNSIVTGITATGYSFRKQQGSDSIALSNFSNSTIGAFGQYSLHFGTNTTAEAGLRVDHAGSYGDFILPRIAFFHRFSETWALRAGAGLGYKIPDPLEVQIIDYPVQAIQPMPSGILPEKSSGYNLECNFRHKLGDHANIFVNHAFFFTQVNQAVIATQLSDGRVVFNNANGEVNTMGFDTYVKLSIKKLELYAGFTYTDAERTYLKSNQFMPLTPRNRFAFVAAHPFAEKWRIGLEGSYIGTQYRDGDTNTPGYFLAALMIERKFGKKYTVVINGENLLDYRQTRHESIVSGSITDPTFKPLWAPIDGRVINISVRITPFEK